MKSENISPGVRDNTPKKYDKKGNSVYSTEEMVDVEISGMHPQIHEKIGAVNTSLSP
jgi:hypothetical protein